MLCLDGAEVKSVAEAKHKSLEAGKIHWLVSIRFSDIYLNKICNFG